MVRVVVRRQMKEHTEGKVQNILLDLRAAALHQPGYVTGQTLVNIADPHEIVTLGTWVSPEHFTAWRESEQRVELAAVLSPLLAAEEQISIYRIVGQEE